MRLISALMEVILSASLSLLCQYENGEITSATFVFKISQLFEFRSVILYDFCSTIYIGPEDRGTVEEISTKLRKGSPSYFNESDYKYYLAVECLERPSMTNNPFFERK
jgi:hypothetical protein